MTDTAFTVIDPIPDDNTSQAIAYGSMYKFAASSKFLWDETEHLMDKEILALMRKIKDPEFAIYVVTKRPDMIWATNPPVPEPDKIRDLWTLRQIIGWGTGKEILDVFRRENLLYASMCGVSEYSEKLLADGVTSSMWSAATTGLIQPIDYEAVRTIKDREEIQAKRDAARYSTEESYEPETRARAVREFNEGYARYLEDEHEEAMEEEDESPEDIVERLDIIREEVSVIGSDILDHPIGSALGALLYRAWHTPARALLERAGSTKSDEKPIPDARPRARARAFRRRT